MKAPKRKNISRRKLSPGKAIPDELAILHPAFSANSVDGAAQSESPPPDILTSFSVRQLFPIVGVGASAGGLEAFTQLLMNLPVDTGMAFVLVQHLDPGHESALPQLLSKTTAMPVKEVTNGTAVAPNEVYVIPPNTQIIISGGILKLTPRERMGGAHRSIDLFFESLAQDQQEQAIGIILSGTATDGTQGLEMIKAEGGITFAQDASAKYDSMPRSAAAAGCVDKVLSPQEIARELGAIARHPALGGKNAASALPASVNGIITSTDPQGISVPPQDLNTFNEILLELRNHRGVDFSPYKTNTIHRRITRRMILNQHLSAEGYAKFLKGNQKELDLLYSDVLISVTSFFRNPQAFDLLKRKVFPALFALAQRDSPLRVWTLGCSTGQEAYSIAMAFTEYCDTISPAPRLQIFATDLNENLLEKARLGLYSKNLVREISEERLSRFFVEEPGGYRISKSLREACVFARQNILSDPPFSRMDLISCRNMLIYIDVELQKRILSNFHYALKPDGFLFLGASESIGGFTNLFHATDKKHKIFSRKAGPKLAYHLPVSRVRPGGKKTVAGARSHPTSDPSFDGNPEREADRILVREFGPPSVVINADLEVVQFRGSTSAFLESPRGKASFDILKMARPALMLPLRTAINEAKKKNAPARRKNIHLDQQKPRRVVDIEVLPLKNIKESFYLVIFSTPASGGLRGPKTRSSRERNPTASSKGLIQLEARRVVELERELAETREYAQSLREEQEAAMEELQSAHEEAQSANEELQSIIEELETSKEELESTNEELTTVNEEMTTRNGELNRSNNDLANLQSSTGLAIVLLGGDMTIRRFSREAEAPFNLMAGDVGRPFFHARHNLEQTDLVGLVTEVIRSGRESSCEVQDRKGHWFFLHIRPYLTTNHKVDGAVLVLVDINPIKESEKAVMASRDFAEAVIRTARDSLLILDASLRVESANEAFYSTFKVSPEESIGRTLFELDHGHWDIPKLKELLLEILPLHNFFNDFEVTHDFEHIGQRTMLLNARTIPPTEGLPSRILLGIQDVTDLLHVQTQLQLSEVRYRRLFEASQDGVLLIDPDTRKILDANPFLSNLLGYPRESLLGKELYEIGLLKDAEASQMAFHELQIKGFIRYEDLPLKTKSGTLREVEFVSNLYQEGANKIIQCNIRDVTERKRSEQDLSEKARLLDLSNDAIIVRDLDDKISLWNKGAEKLYGWTCAEVIGKHLHAFLHTEFPKPMEEIVALLCREGHYNGEVIQIARDGRQVPALCRWVLDRGTNSILTSFTDITDRKQMENDLRQSEERYRTLFHSIDEGFCVVEMLFEEKGATDYRFLEVNPSFYKQTGLKDVVGRTMRELAPAHEAYWFSTFGHVALTGQPVRFANEAKALNAWFDVYAFALSRGESKKIAILFTNITERKAADESLRRTQEQLKDRAGQLEGLVTKRTAELTVTNKQLEAFVYSIAHDLRAPLRSMQGFSSMLLDEVGPELSETARDFARRINLSAQFLDSLLMDLLTFSGVAQKPIKLSPVNLEKVVQFVMARLEKEIVDKGGCVERAGVWPDVIAHEATLSQVLGNLVTNALKFVAQGVNPRVLLRTENQGEYVRFWVEDNGIGIPTEYQDQIFRLFTRLNGDKFQGTGIGLAIVEKGIEKMGGLVGVDSSPGRGSRFWFELRKA